MPIRPQRICACLVAASSCISGCGNQTPLTAAFGSLPDAVETWLNLAPESQRSTFCQVSAERNEYQAGLCPEVRPWPGATDEATGITFSKADWWNFYHWPDVCHRGTGGVLDDVDYSETATGMIDALTMLSPESLTASIQCCYDSHTDELTDSGSFDFQTPPRPLDFLFRPDKAGDWLWLHNLLDVAPAESDVCP